MKKLLIIVAAVVGLGLLALGLGAAVTSAQGGDGNPLQTFLSKVADKLGVSQDELTTAIKEAQLEMVDEAVADSRITEEQAEALRARIEEGGVLFPRFRGEGEHYPRPGVCQRGVGFILEAAAEVLDMTKGELIAELNQGNSLADVAEAQGMSVGTFKEELLAQVQTQLDGLVQQGNLTEEQAARLYEKVQSNIDRIVNAHDRPGADRCAPGHRPGHTGPGESGSEGRPFGFQ